MHLQAHGTPGGCATSLLLKLFAVDFSTIDVCPNSWLDPVVFRDGLAYHGTTGLKPLLPRPEKDAAGDAAVLLTGWRMGIALCVLLIEGRLLMQSHNKGQQLVENRCCTQEKHLQLPLPYHG